MRSRVAEVMHNQHDQFPEHDVPVARIDVVASRASGIGTLYLRGKRPDSEQSTTVIAEIASMTASWRRASIALGYRLRNDCTAACAMTAPKNRDRKRVGEGKVCQYV